MGAPSPFERQRGRIDKPLVIDAVKRGLAAAGVIFIPLALTDCAPAFGQEPKSYVSRAAPPDTPTPDGIQSIRIGDGGTVTVRYFPTATPAPSVPTQRPEVSGIQATRAPSPRPNPTSVPLRLTEPPATRAAQATNTVQRTASPTPRPETGIRPVLNAGLVGQNRGFSVKYDSRLYGKSIDGSNLESVKQAVTQYGSAYPVSTIVFWLEGNNYKDVNAFVDQKVDPSKKLPRSRTTIAGNEAIIVTNDSDNAIIKVAALRDKTGRTFRISFAAAKNYPPNEYRGPNYTSNDYVVALNASLSTFTLLAQTPTPDYFKNLR